MLKSFVWIRLVFGTILIATGINSYPFVSRNKVFHVGYEVHEEAIKRNLDDSSSDPIWLKIEDVAKSHISSLDNLDSADRLRFVLLCGIGGAIAALGILELILLHRVKRR